MLGVRINKERKWNKESENLGGVGSNRGRTGGTERKTNLKRDFA